MRPSRGSRSPDRRSRTRSSAPAGDRYESAEQTRSTACQRVDHPRAVAEANCEDRTDAIAVFELSQHRVHQCEVSTIAAKVPPGPSIVHFEPVGVGEDRLSFRRALDVEVVAERL